MNRIREIIECEECGEDFIVNPNDPPDPLFEFVCEECVIWRIESEYDSLGPGGR